MYGLADERVHFEMRGGKLRELASKAHTDEEMTHVYTMPRSLAALRFLGMGFRIASCVIDRRLMVDSIAINPVFLPMAPGMLWFHTRIVCICGRTEELRTQVHPRDIRAGYANVFDTIEQGNQLSRGHLLSDGYTSEQIDEMELRCAIFEDGIKAEMRLRAERERYG